MAAEGEMKGIETTMKYRYLLDDLFGEEFVDGELIPRIMSTTVNDEEEAANKLDNCLAYLQARGMMGDPNGPLVCNLGPDEVWHVFILFTEEYSKFCEFYFGVYLHHDPAEEPALVNTLPDTARTVDVFERHGIVYDPGLWCDHIMYANGAILCRSELLPRLGEI